MNKKTKILSLHPASQAVPMEENAVPVVVVTPEQLKELIREVIRQEFRGVNGHGEEDSLLTADEAPPSFKCYSPLALPPCQQTPLHQAP